jgi:hypothetical protein
MKKKTCQNGGMMDHPFPEQKNIRKHVWCEKFGYFIDLDACEERSYRKVPCRRCFAKLIQQPLPFD